MTHVRVKAHDIGVRFTDELELDAFDFSGADIKFLLKHVKGTPVVSQSATFDTTLVGTATCHYDSVDGDLDISGEYQQEWEVTSGALVLTFPSENFNKVTVLQDLNDA